MTQRHSQEDKEQKKFNKYRTLGQYKKKKKKN